MMSLTQTNVPANSPIFCCYLQNIIWWISLHILLPNDFINMTSYCWESAFFFWPLYSRVYIGRRERDCMSEIVYNKQVICDHNKTFNRRSIKINAKQIKFIKWSKLHLYWYCLNAQKRSIKMTILMLSLIFFFALLICVQDRSAKIEAKVSEIKKKYSTNNEMNLNCGELEIGDAKIVSFKVHVHVW